jgi:hypothetical protein
MRISVMEFNTERMRTNKKLYRCVVMVVTILCMLAAVANGQQASKKAKREFAFKGKVVKVDANAKTVTVNNDYLPGWRNSYIGTYTVNNREVLMIVEPGDQVTARVYEGNFKVLYDLRVIPPEDLPVYVPKKKFN